MDLLDHGPRATAQVLRSAARHLETVDPNAVLGEAIEDAVSMSEDEPALSSQFAESTPGSLTLMVQPSGSLADTVDLSTQTARGVVRRHFGREAARWFDERVAPAADTDEPAFFGGGFDRSGVAETSLGFSVASHQLDALPPRLAALTRAALSHLPGARVATTVVRCGRRAGTQQISVAPTQELSLAALRPLMHEVGVGRQHASLMSSAAFLLGARFKLPANSARITFRPLAEGVEMRLDIILERVPDPPRELMSLLRLWMGERPRSLAGLDRWLSAFTFDGFPNAGDVTVLSVWVRPTVPARMALFLRPAAIGRKPRRAPPRLVAPRRRFVEAAPWD